MWDVVAQCLWDVVAQWLESQFEICASSFTPYYLCLSDETLKAVGPFDLVSMPVEVKYPTQGGKCVTCRGLHILAERRTTH